MAAANQSTNMLKVNQISKDLNIKSKDLAEIITEQGIEYKAQKALAPVEFSIIFDKLTKDNQINGIGDYLDGITYIPSKKNEEIKEEQVVSKETKLVVETKEVEVKAAAEEIKPKVQEIIDKKEQTSTEAESVSKAEEKKADPAPNQDIVPVNRIKCRNERDKAL